MGEDNDRQSSGLQLGGERATELRGFVRRTRALGAAHRTAGERKRAHAQLTVGDLGVSSDGTLAAAAHCSQESPFRGDTLESIDIVQTTANVVQAFVVVAD